MKIEHLIRSLNSTSMSKDGINWHPCRPETAENTFLWLRIKAAWRVLTGKSDATEWPLGQ